MRIESIEAIPIAIPLAKNFGGSTYSVLTRCTVVTRMRTDAGLVSEVYNGDNRHHLRALVAIIENELAPLIIGEDARAIERLWTKMFPTAHAIRDRKLAAIARTGAPVVASANPGCAMHLAAAGLDVRHPVEIVDEALRRGE